MTVKMLEQLQKLTAAVTGIKMCLILKNNWSSFLQKG